MPRIRGNALEISLDFQFGPIPAIFSAHAPAVILQYCMKMNKARITISSIRGRRRP